MKKIAFCLLMIAALFMVSCTTPAERSIMELEEIVMRVKTDERCYTVEDYEAIVAELEALNEKYADARYTVGQYQRMEELNAELAAALSDKFVEQLGGAFGGFMNGFVKAFSGALVDGMSEVVCGMNEIVEGLQEVVDEMNEMEGMDDK